MASTRPPLSPSRSPTGRLPSPPPIAEDQSAPQSPGLQANQTLPAPHVDTHSASRRIQPGTKAADMAEGPPLIEISEIDSAFQLTEHLKSLHYIYTHPSSDRISPLTKQLATQLSQPPTSVDRTLWLYELCRFLVQRVNSVIVGLFADSPACSAQTCPEMRASEWQYLCAVHDPPKACCAIDYCCHTLDWAANTLTSPKHFPSRLSLGPDNSVPQNQIRQLTNIFRRVYRIFAHAWFSHRDMFWTMEGKTGLYVFFKTVCDSYSLIPEDNYTIPQEAEGKEPAPTQSSPTTSSFATQPPPPPPSAPASILKRPTGDSDPSSQESTPADTDTQNSTTLAPSATARRHRHSPSKGAPVGTVPEETEEDEDPGTATAPTDSTLDDENNDLPRLASLTRADTQIHSPVPVLPSSPPPPSTDEAPIAEEDEEPPNISIAPIEISDTANVPFVAQLSPTTASAAMAAAATDPDDEGEGGPAGGASLVASGDVPATEAQPLPQLTALSSGAKSFASFSPASPKASTFEELTSASVVGGNGGDAKVNGGDEGKDAKEEEEEKS